MCISSCIKTSDISDGEDRRLEQSIMERGLGPRTYALAIFVAYCVGVIGECVW